MNYKEEFENELNETKMDRNEFSKTEKEQKNSFAEYIKEAIPTFMEERQKEMQENKCKKFIKRLLKVL